MAETRTPFAMNSLPKPSTFALPTGLANDSTPFASTTLVGLSPTLERNKSFNTRSKVTVQFRYLPYGMDIDKLRTMVLFAPDLGDIKLLGSTDTRFQSAIATYNSEAGAIAVRDGLNGKTNGTPDTRIVVEILPGSPGSFGSRRNTVDGTESRQQSGSGASSSSSNNNLSRQQSRYSHSFQRGRPSPPIGSPTATSKEFPIPDNNNNIQSLFTPQSPVANSYGDYRNSGKAVINDDVADDETGELLKDPLSYARNDYQQAPRFNNPIPQFGNLSLNTSVVASNSRHQSLSSAFTSPRAVHSPGMQSPAAMPNVGSAVGYPVHGSARPPGHPPINPADQHPPCNTLYVGNLPHDTEEDELKQIFCKQRGFKRLMYRVKAQGPMCFVEFDDVSLATRALSDLYGAPLHNSQRGGIRLSFSRNPLGVRTGQAGPHAPMSPQAYGNGVGAPPGFSTTHGPPPGLGGPGGRNSHNYAAPTLQDSPGRGYYGPPRFGGMSPQFHHQASNGSYGNEFMSMNGGFQNMTNASYSNNYPVNARHPNGISSNGEFMSGR